MKKITLKGLYQDLYYEKLDNGLDIYFLPIKNTKNYIMEYVVKYGSIDTSFKVDDKIYNTKSGIAHFLEHKMFEQEDNITPFSFTSKSGTYCNASTSYTYTNYYFEGNKNFNKNLNYLIKYVNSPYLTDTNVNKEKGIIIEELNQYNSNSGYFFEEALLKALLVKDKHRIDIGGKINDVKNITKEELYDIYNTFYTPNNMFILISGNFDLDKALNIIKTSKYLNKSKKIVERLVELEPSYVNNKELNLKYNVMVNKLGYALKIKLPKEYDLILLTFYISMFINIKFGSTSLFRERMKEKNLYNYFSISKYFIKDYVLILLKMETDKEKEIIKEIEKELEIKDIDINDFNRKKKSLIASYISYYDYYDQVMEDVHSDIIRFNKVIDNKIDIFKSLNIDTYKDIINKLDFNNKAIVRITKE